MASTPGEMPFLDHLEELRKRILLAMAGVIVGVGTGWFLTRHFNLIHVIEEPIKAYVPGGKLVTSTLIAAFSINLKFAMVLGLVLASPWVLFQLWQFLSPALTSKEKRAILPSLGIGLVLFLGGAAIGWVYVLPPTIKWLVGFDSGNFTQLITFESYMSLTINLLVAMGVSAETPLIMIVLASLGVLSYRRYVQFRRFAIFLCFVGGAILSPAPEVVMMTLFTIPLILLYEVGVAGAWLVERRRARAARIAAALGVFVLLMIPRNAHAQGTPPPTTQVPVTTQQRPPGQGDTTRRVTGAGAMKVDTGSLKHAGLPTKPQRTFGTPDSIMQALLDRKGFAATRFQADTVTADVSSHEIDLQGRAATLRDGSQLEGKKISYSGGNCGSIEAQGEPQMFEKGQQPMVGRTLRIDNICGDSSRALIGEAFTSLAEHGANWFMRGNLAVDSSGKRLYGANAEFTSCDLPDPHYHFQVGRIKWIAQSVIVARPAVLYIRDVPVFWLPFIFQDTKRDRSSGILIPRFGFNDIVRTNRNYNRQVTNVGYYWAPNNYMDLTASLDWFSNRYTQVSSTFNYKWLNRFIAGSLTLQKVFQTGGGTSNLLNWSHDQKFDVTTTLRFSLNYNSNSTIQLANAVDPLAATRDISSSLNFTKLFSWGLVNLGGTRRQALGTGAGSMAFPTLQISPKPFNISSTVIFSPALDVSNTTNFKSPVLQPVILGFGGLDSSQTKGIGSSRETTVKLDLGTTIGHFSIPTRLNYFDRTANGRVPVTQRVAVTPGSIDSVTLTTVRTGTFSSGLDFDTGINLPILFSGTWKVTPSVSLTNIVAGEPYLLRSVGSNGDWVAQGKKVQGGLTASPTFFGLSRGGLGPYTAFRYTFAPVISLQWSPAASVSEAYARAVSSLNGGGLVDIPSSTVFSINLHQVIDAKGKPPRVLPPPGTKPLLPADSLSRSATVGLNQNVSAVPGTKALVPVDSLSLGSGAPPEVLPKKQLLSVSTSSLSYDFVQASLPHKSGWRTGVITNSFTSDLIPGFTVSTTHDLFEGDFTSDTAHFSPFLSNANASLQLNGGMLRPIARLLGLVSKDSLPPKPTTSAYAQSTSPFAQNAGPTQFGAPVGVRQGTPRSGFNASLSYSLSRQRPHGVTGVPVSTEPGTINTPVDPFGNPTLLPLIASPAQSQLGINMSFSPSQFWTVSWTTNYDITLGRFQSHQIHLQRDLHDWRASFDFTKGPTGNFALYFSVYLMNLPDIKFDYNQTTLLQTPVQQ